MAALLGTASQISLVSPLVPAAGQTKVGPTLLHPQWDRIVGDLLRLRELSDDWDGQGSRALDATNVDRALAWVEDMRQWPGALPPSSVAPGTQGELVLEWRGDAFHLAAEISDPSQVEWLLAVPGQPIKQWDTDFRSLWIVHAEK